VTRPRVRAAGELPIVALMIDGVHFAESCCIVALGIDLDGVKHPLALVEGSTENATLVTDLLVGLRERGLDVTRPMLVGIDGSKALRKAVVDVLDHPVIQRCQLHKIRNVKDHLPQRLRSGVGRRPRNRSSTYRRNPRAFIARPSRPPVPPTAGRGVAAPWRWPR
jgi:putative transposase